MKQLIFVLSICVALTGCHKNPSHNPGDNCAEPVGLNKHYSKADTLKKMLARYTAAGVPGSVIAVYSGAEGWWGTSAGFARLESNDPMKLCHLQYLQSVSKTFMAIGLLHLYEEGKLRLDAPITDYLPLKYSRYVDQAKDITVRMLMNHTSGVNEYTDDPDFIAFLLAHPTYAFTTEEYLKIIEHKKSRFTPGSRFVYTNTNYELLALIADAITGDHARLISQTVIDPLRLTQTFYRNHPGYLKYGNLTDSYIDLSGTGSLQNVTEMQWVNVASMIGDDGIVTTPMDAVKFLKGLMEGKLLSPGSMAQMKTWVTDDSKKPVYGLGLYHVEYSGFKGYGHSGAGIGAGCTLFYFPAKNTYIFLGTNIGTLVDGPIVSKVNELKKSVFDIVLR